MGSTSVKIARRDGRWALSGEERCPCGKTDVERKGKFHEDCLREIADNYYEQLSRLLEAHKNSC